MWRIITVDDCIARATTIEQKATSKLGSRMPAPETKLSSGRFPVATCDTETETDDNATTTDETTTDDTSETTCETNCACAFPPLLGSGNMLANEYYKNSLLPLEASLDYACARLRTAISQGGFSNMPKGLRKIPLSCFDLVLSLAVYHYASRTLNQELQNQDPRRRAYEQALDDLEKIREGKLLVEDEDSDDVGSTKTAASIAREIGYTPRWQRGNYNKGLW